MLTSTLIIGGLRPLKFYYCAFSLHTVTPMSSLEFEHNVFEFCSSFVGLQLWKFPLLGCGRRWMGIVSESLAITKSGSDWTMNGLPAYNANVVNEGLELITCLLLLPASLSLPTWIILQKGCQTTKMDYSSAHLERNWLLMILQPIFFAMMSPIVWQEKRCPPFLFRRTKGTWKAEIFLSHSSSQKQLPYPSFIIVNSISLGPLQYSTTVLVECWVSSPSYQYLHKLVLSVQRPLGLQKEGLRSLGNGVVMLNCFK